jgi:hypothetical protein
MTHQFQIRFRAAHEDEGKGSLCIACDLPDRAMSHEIRRIVDQVSRDHPQAQFDGMLYYMSKYT